LWQKAAPVVAPTKEGDPQEWLAGVLRERFTPRSSQIREAALSEIPASRAFIDMRVAIRRRFAGMASGLCRDRRKIPA
jgi:hypothetical protein